MSPTLLGLLAFYLFAVLAVSGAIIVAWSRSIVHSAFALLATFLGVAGLYLLLAADLLAIVQLLVYVGGILVLILFAVMLTSRIADTKVTNPSLGKLGGVFALVAVSGPLLWIAPHFPTARQNAEASPTTAAIGNALLGRYVLPFEVVSLLLLAALVGALTLAKSPVGNGGRSPITLRPPKGAP